MTKHFVPDTPPAGGYPRGKYPRIERTADERKDEQDAERKAVRSLSRAQLAALVAEQDVERAACVTVRQAAERLRERDRLMVTTAEVELARLPRNERVELTTATMRPKTARPRPPQSPRPWSHIGEPGMPEDVAQISKIILPSNLPSISRQLSKQASVRSASVPTKTAEKPAVNAIYERVSLTADGVWKRLKDAHAAADLDIASTGPRRAGNDPFWERIDRSQDGRQVSNGDDASLGDILDDLEVREVSDDGDGSLDKQDAAPAYDAFGCGGFLVAKLPKHNRASNGPLAGPKQNKALDAKATMLIRKHEPPRAKPDQESVWEPRQFGDRNAVLRNAEALEWIAVEEADPKLEAARTKVVIPLLRSQQSIRAFAAENGLDRDRVRRTIDKYVDAIAGRINNAGGALKADLRDVSAYHAPRCPKAKRKTKKNPLTMQLKAPLAGYFLAYGIEGFRSPGRFLIAPAEAISAP